MKPLNLPAWSAYAPRVGSVSRLLVGFSGGLDSTVLLSLAQQWSRQSGIPLLAVHVNHQLSPNASQWQHHCEQWCSQHNIPFYSEAVTIQLQGEGLEAAARKARYAVFSGIAEPEDLLLLGHHRDDQVETLLQRLLRGSGVLGLRGMDEIGQSHNIRIARPLLAFAKSELRAHAEAKQWFWVEDESNQRDDFDRNFLRNQVMPLLQTRWPQAPAALVRSGQHCAEAQTLLDERALEDLLPRLQSDGSLLCSPDDTLSPARVRNLIRYWLRGLQLPLPGEAQLAQLVNALIPAAVDAVPVVAWPGAEVRRYRSALHALPPLAPVDSSMLFSFSLSTQMLPGGGELIINIAPCEQSNRQAIALRLLRSGKLSLRFRQGGESVKLSGRPTRPLKKILQDADLPPWWRDRLPLLYKEDELVAIPGVGVSESFVAVAGEDAVRLQWRPPILPHPWHR